MIVATRERNAWREDRRREETRRENYVSEQPQAVAFPVVSYRTDCGLRAPRASIQTKINAEEQAIFHFESGPDGSREPPVCRLSSHPLEAIHRIIFELQLVLANPYNYGKTETRINPETDWSEYICAHQRISPLSHDRVQLANGSGVTYPASAN